MKCANEAVAVVVPEVRFPLFMNTSFEDDTWNSGKPEMLFTSISMPSNPSDTENSGPADPSTSNIPDWLTEPDPINLNAVESVSPDANDLDIIAAEDAVCGNGSVIGKFVSCEPSPIKLDAEI